MSENMNPMDKFISQYQTFCEHEAIKDLNEQSQIALFGNYCQAVIAKLAAQQKPAAQPAQQQQSSPSRIGCTSRQKRMIMRLIKKGCMEEPTWEALTVKSASRLIDKGLAAERRMDREEEEAQNAPPPKATAPKGEYGGSYSIV